MPQNWLLGEDSGGVKVNVWELEQALFLTMRPRIFAPAVNKPEAEMHNYA